MLTRKCSYLISKWVELVQKYRSLDTDSVVNERCTFVTDRIFIFILFLCNEYFIKFKPYILCFCLIMMGSIDTSSRYTYHFTLSYINISFIHDYILVTYMSFIHYYIYITVTLSSKDFSVNLSCEVYMQWGTIHTMALNINFF